MQIPKVLPSVRRVAAAYDRLVSRDECPLWVFSGLYHSAGVPTSAVEHGCCSHADMGSREGVGPTCEPTRPRCPAPPRASAGIDVSAGTYRCTDVSGLPESGRRWAGEALSDLLVGLRAELGQRVGAFDPADMFFVADVG
jgi:hypothetical protein